MNLREVSQCQEKAPTRTFSLLKDSTNAFTIKSLVGHYDKQASFNPLGKHEIGMVFLKDHN